MLNGNLEGLSQVNYVSDVSKGFTLAEMLITLGIIGIIAAITMPILMTNINERVNSERQANIAYKVTQAMEQMRAHGKLVQYESTDKFVDELQKYLKIQKRCDASNIAECWPTKTVTDADGNEFEVSNAKQRKNILKDATTGNADDNNVGLILADGASIVLTYDNSKLPVDIGDKVTTVMRENSKGQKIAYTTEPTTGSIDFIMDVNGKRKPNTEGKDILSFSTAHFAKSGHACDEGPAGCLYLIPSAGYINCDKTDSNIVNTIEYTSYCGSGCKDNNNWGIDCTHDYWAGANKACKEAGMTLPNMETLQLIYAKKSSYSGINANIANNNAWFWSSEESIDYPSESLARDVYFGDGRTDNNGKSLSYFQVICVAE